MAGFFDNVSSGEMSAGEVNELQKALAAGYGTDSSRFTGGRALIPENLESEVVNVVAQLKEDCKVMNSVRRHLFAQQCMKLTCVLDTVITATFL